MTVSTPYVIVQAELNKELEKWSQRITDLKRQIVSSPDKLKMARLLLRSERWRLVCLSIVPLSTAEAAAAAVRGGGSAEEQSAVGNSPKDVGVTCFQCSDSSSCESRLVASP